MSEIIAGLYELNEKIGAGGGGVVYLGRHIRLDKTIVLKADKRSLKADTSSLRREVDLLKGLSQTYIPQVYDFVQENDVVYTVMDYIDGESLDKRIKRGQLPSQPELVKWARQILEALEYLHTRPPHGILHADIKPANIMLRSNGDICLIDYNIALALGIPPEKAPIGTMTEFGNQCGASIPCTFSYMIRDALLNKSNRVLLSGFGVGLSWVNCILDINQIYCSGVIEY